MNTKLNFNFALNLIPMVAGVALLAYPELAAPDLEAKVEDGAWNALTHAAGKSAAMVETLRANPFIADLVHLAVTKEVAAAQAELENVAEKGEPSLAGVTGTASEGTGNPTEVTGNAGEAASVKEAPTQEEGASDPLVLAHESA